MIITNSGYLFKNDKNLFFDTKIDNSNTNEYITHISKKGDEYNLKSNEEFEKIYNKSIKTHDDRLWLVIKTTTFKEGNGYRLRIGDIIKLGKVMLKVKETKCVSESGDDQKTMKHLIREKTMIDFAPNSNVNILNNNVDLEMTIIQHNVCKNKNKITSSCCRICLMDDNDSDNPLINPCSCIGSVRFIHLQCIRQWLKSKITTKEFSFLTVHSFKSNFDCEICKSPIPGKLIIY